ncbi:histidine kinase [Geobacter sp. AOG1]|uniref:histidine kinase n=1 Tax=Geobacter sp. AOG1 TaxID=1566346 RepID=UPI001CC496D6|nr:histidine kinase [Geobacter sp. AOG1]GFE57213.1 histidine kinase [Geobacter sp. AOG1]
MSMKKRLLAVAAVSALTVATAVPALALENEFHGLFRLRGIIDNFNNGTGGKFTPSVSSPTSNYIEQRARLMYIAKANDDLKLVTHFEIDSRWGDNSYGSNGTTRNNGGAIGADQTNLETKNIYLDFNIPSTPLNVKLGIQGFDDGYKGVIFNNDGAGLVAKAKMSFGSLGGAYFRFDDATTGTGAAATATAPASFTNSYLGVPASSTTAGSVIQNSTPGYLTRDMVNLNAKINISKAVKVGADYYLLYSDVLRQSQDKTAINMFGVNAEAVAGPVTIDGFVLYQTGKLGTTAFPGNAQKLSSLAANVGAKAKLGPGTLRANALYLSGERSTSGSTRHDFQTIDERSADTPAHAFYPSEMQIMLRNKFNMTSDRAVVMDLNNSGQGLLGGFVGYDLAIDKFFVNSNVGFGAVARDTTGTHKGDYLGTEINTEVGYKLFDNLTTSVQAAYMVLGDYFKPASGSWPVNPYTTKLQVNYSF